MPDQMGPDERVLRAHIEGGPFQSGVDRGYWRLIVITWPHVFLVVSAAPRDQAPSEYVFRFECSNYPRVPPTARPWDAKRNVPLEAAKWPGGSGRVAFAFRPDWLGGQALYLPCDRLAIAGHDAWRTQHSHLIWKTTSDITLYLEAIYDLLHSRDYSGCRSA